MEIKRHKSLVLVFLQFLLIGLLIISTNKANSKLLAGLVIAVAMLMAGWSVFTMRKSRLRISPVPAQDAVLITSGPYRYTRHPMYTSVLLGTAGLLVMEFSVMRFILWVALFFVLFYKLKWEETLLAEKFPGYKSYRLHTKMLLPFLF